MFHFSALCVMSQPPVVASCQDKFAAIREAAGGADWLDAYDFVDPDSAPKRELLELLKSAPDEFAQGVIYGKFLARQQLALATGRAFL